MKVCKVTKRDDSSKKPLEVLVMMMFYYLSGNRMKAGTIARTFIKEVLNIDIELCLCVILLEPVESETET